MSLLCCSWPAGYGPRAASLGTLSSLLCSSWLAVSTCRCYVVVGWSDMDTERQARRRDRCCYVVVGWPCLHVVVML